MDTNNEKLMLHEMTYRPVEDPKNAFSQLIKYHRYHSRPDKKLSTKDLAKRVGIGPEIFRKIINMQKPTKKRDCIIAICAVLKMNVQETNKALNYYNNMPLLDQGAPRDNLLMTILEYQKESYLDLDNINALLTINNYSSLDIINSRGISKTYETDTLYKVEDISVHTYLNNQRLHDTSLSSRYRIDNYQYEANMVIKDDHKSYLIKITTNNQNTLYTTPKHTYFSLEDTGLFKPCFIQLLGMIKKEKTRIKQILNDTRNYKNRLNARVIGNHIYVYEEIYDHDYPEFNVYYLMEYIGGAYHFSIAHSSQFMYKHMPNYKEYYEEELEGPYVSYDSIEEIDQEIESCTDQCKKTVLHMRRNRYLDMKKDIEEALEKIKNKELYIESIDELNESVIDYYNIDPLFLDDHSIKVNDKEETVELTFEELERSYELGYKSLEDIVSNKKLYGNIEKVLQ